MSGLPITNPVAVLTTALYDALAPVAPLFNGLPAYYWLRSVEGADDALTSGALAGILIAQAQTPQAFAGWVGEAAAEGGIVIRAVAMSDDAAQGLRDDAVAALAVWQQVTPEIVVSPLGGVATAEALALTAFQAPAAYRVTFAWQQEIIVPPVGPRYTATAQYAVTIRRAGA